MSASRCIRSVFRRLAAALALAAAAYATYAGVTWYRYGRIGHRTPGEDRDSLLDRFIPAYEVVERHRTHVAAPAEITFSASCNMNLQQSAIVRGIIKAWGLILGSRPEENALPQGLVAQVKALGWGVLAEIPAREIAFGAVTQAWVANVVFHALRPEEFAAFREPGYVKIVWTLRADPIGTAESVASTETRVATTDPTARARFRWYWSFFSPGVVLIRRISLGLVKAEAERRMREARPERQTAGLLGSSAL